MIQFRYRVSLVRFFFFNDTAPTEIYTLSLHDALPISRRRTAGRHGAAASPPPVHASMARRSEEHTSELQSRRDLVCRLLLEKKETISELLTIRCHVWRLPSHNATVLLF